jgi:hypothetical protein
VFFTAQHEYPDIRGDCYGWVKISSGVSPITILRKEFSPTRTSLRMGKPRRVGVQRSSNRSGSLHLHERLFAKTLHKHKKNNDRLVRYVQWSRNTTNNPTHGPAICPTKNRVSVPVMDQPRKNSIHPTRTLMHCSASFSIFSDASSKKSISIRSIV